jgi:hypothetical protein
MSASTQPRFLALILAETMLFLPIVFGSTNPSSPPPSSQIIQGVVDLNPKKRFSFTDLLRSNHLSAQALAFDSPPDSSSGDVLAANTPVEPSLPSPSPRPAPPLPRATTKNNIPPKDSYTIAIIGDSMIDTMGEDLPYLKESLAQKYSNLSFKLYNYGTGAQNVEEGLGRFNQSFRYKTRDFPPLSELKPDIIIVGSFSYNPFSPHNRDKHWLNLANLVQEAQRISPQVFLLAETAPLRSRFGQGPNGVNWSQDGAFAHSNNIIEQLENTIGLAKALNIPLVDAFNPSLTNDLKEGKPQYVNPGDGIHPSVSGHQLIADLIANKLSSGIIAI